MQLVRKLLLILMLNSVTLLSKLAI